MKNNNPFYVSKLNWVVLELEKANFCMYGTIYIPVAAAFIGLLFPFLNFNLSEEAFFLFILGFILFWIVIFLVIDAFIIKKTRDINHKYTCYSGRELLKLKEMPILQTKERIIDALRYSMFIEKLIKNSGRYGIQVTQSLSNIERCKFEYTIKFFYVKDRTNYILNLKIADKDRKELDKLYRKYYNEK